MSRQLTADAGRDFCHCMELELVDYFLRGWILHYSLQALPELIRAARLLTSFYSSGTVGEGEGGVGFLAGRGSQKGE